MGVATAVAGLGISGAKFFEGRRMQKKAEKFIENFQWQDLQNPYDNVQVSTLGSDLRTEEAARTTATSVDALRTGGTRALVGGLGRIQSQNNLLNREIAANLDQQQKQLDYASANQEVNNQNIMEQRQANELAGYGQMFNTGLGMKHSGFDTALGSLGFAGQTKLGEKVDNSILSLFNKKS